MQWHALVIFVFLLAQLVTCSFVCQHSGGDAPAQDLHSTVLLQSRREALQKANSTDTGGTLQKDRQRKFIHDGVLVVVPGLGSEERALTVERNVQWLKRQNLPFECLIYVYLSEEEFPLAARRFEPCKLIRHAGRWLSHLKAVPLQTTKMQWVVHMEDGTEPQENVNLSMILQTMVANGLGWAAPTFDTSTTPNDYIDEQYPVLNRQASTRIGRFVDFIELHFDVFTRDYFACLQRNIDSSDDDILLGWGMDRLLPALCRESGRLGLMDKMTMVKRHWGSYDHTAAQRGMDLFVGKHAYTPGPTFSTLGELLAPPER